MKNWFGRESHPSDSLLTWHDDVHPGGRDSQLVDQIRAAWDLIHSTPQLAGACKLLMERKQIVAEADAADDASGEDL